MRVSKAILETPNASDYERLVAVNAIKAMREPTEKMLEASNTGEFDNKLVWYQMIDAVINE